MMNKKLVLLAFLFAIFCLLPASNVYAMGSAPPLPTQEVGVVPTASEEALAKEQVDNLKDISINSQSIGEGYAKFMRDVYSGKKYLYEFNGLARKQLIADLLDKNQNWKYRYSIIDSINPDDPPQAYDAYKIVFEDKSERVELRRIAIGNIASTKIQSRKADAVNILIEALKDDDDDIASSAANGLGGLKDNSAILPLIDAVKLSRERYKKLLRSGWKDYENGSTNAGMRIRTTMRALGAIKAREAVPLLIEVMSDLDFDHEVDADSINGFAAMSLGEIGDKSALPALKKALEENNYKQHMDTRMGIRIGIDKIEKGD